MSREIEEEFDAECPKCGCKFTETVNFTLEKDEW